MGMSRRERERKERADLILRVGRKLLLERGYLGLTMDRIASATEYSKGTIYQHFRNKEEVVLALAIETAEVRVAFFERAATFRGRPRERMSAVGLAAELLVRLHPEHLRSELIVAASSVRDKVSSERQAELQGCEHRCMGIAAGIVRDAVAAGDLVLPEGSTPETLSFGLWSLCYGSFVLIATEQLHLGPLGIREPLLALAQSQQRLLDGYGWAPLSEREASRATRERILTEVFPEEHKALAAIASQARGS